MRAPRARRARVGGSAVKIAVPATTATAETISAPAGEVTAAIAAVSSGPLMKISSIIVRVQRVGRLVQARLEQVGPHRAQHGRRRRDREAADEAAQQQHDGRRAELGEADDRAERDGVHERERARARGARRSRSTSRPCTGAPIAEPGRQRARDGARDRERARLLAQVEHDRQRVDADRQPREQRRGDQRAHVGRAQDVGVAPHAPQASSRACAKHGVHHRRRQLAGERVLLARVKAAEQRPRLAVGDRAVAELRLRARDRRAAERRAQPQRALPREAAEAHDDVDVRQQRDLALEPLARSSRAPPASAGSPAARSAPRRRCRRRRSRSPSSRATDSAWLASPTRCSDGEQEVAGAVAGEDPARAVAAVRGGREAEDQHRAPPDRRSPASAGPSSPSRGTPPASRARPARATRRDEGSGGSRRPPR